MCLELMSFSIKINPESEANAAVCLSCIVMLEGFQQFKQQCHDNEKFLKTVPWKDDADVLEANEEDEEETAMECDFLEEACDDTRDSEDEGLVEFVELPSMAKKKVSVASLKTQVETPKAPQMQPEKLITSRRENIFLAEPTSRVRKQIARPVSSPRTDLIEMSKALEEKFRPPEPTEDDLPKLKDSYPDYFHFEKKPHAKFFTLVYYGERFNSAVYEPEKTYYRCAYKRKFQCPAVLNVTNDYTEFVRRLEHNHDEQEPKKSKIMPDLLTPRQALPIIFRKCWRKVEQINPEQESDAVLCFDCIVTLEGFFQFKEQCHVNDEFLKTLPPKSCVDDSDASELDEGEVALECDYLEEVQEAGGRVRTVNDSEEEGLVEDAYEPPVTSSRGKEIITVKVEPEVDTRKSSRVRKPTAKVLVSPKNSIKIETPVKPEPAEPPQKRPKLETPQIREPMANELPQLQESYPEYFHFERGPRSVHYNLIFYGERYNSAIYGSRYTFWQCAHRRAHRCPAMVRVTNDYASFERRFEHTHGDLPEKGEFDLYTPQQVLPEVFRICWQKAMMKKAKRKETTGLRRSFQNTTEDNNEEDFASDEDDQYVDDQEEGASLQKALRKSGVLDSDED